MFIVRFGANPEFMHINKQSQLNISTNFDSIDSVGNFIKKHFSTEQKTKIVLYLVRPLVDITSLLLVDFSKFHVILNIIAISFISCRK
jgi:hypothetical protein